MWVGKEKRLITLYTAKFSGQRENEAFFHAFVKRGPPLVIQQINANSCMNETRTQSKIALAKE